MKIGDSTKRRLCLVARSGRGATAVEYSLLLSILCLTVTSSVATFGKESRRIFFQTGYYVGGGSQTTGEINPPGNPPPEIGQPPGSGSPGLEKPVQIPVQRPD